MTVTPLDPSNTAGAPDAPRASSIPRVGAAATAAARTDGDSDFAVAVARAFGSASDALQRAESAESAFTRGRGGLQEMVLERARADVALSIAAATTTHVAQSLQTVLGMQV